MEYKEFLEHIYQRYSGNVKLGLERMYGILEEMGNPNKSLKGIHVAGTNGKGSTSAMCEAMGLEHGFTTGLNTSPHLIDYRERIRLNGKDITFGEILRIHDQWQDVFNRYDASFFEITTALAFHAFSENKVDFSVFEVGLGGRLDGTNPFNSTVSIITTISYDHPKSLGDTVEKIAYEKAGIIKPGQPVILGKIKDSCLQVIMEVAEKQKADVFLLGNRFQTEEIKQGLSGTEFIYSFPEMGINSKRLLTNLLGKHQAGNASLAITAFLHYMEKMGLEAIWDKIETALKKVNWVGRMQIISLKPTIILDGAHNEEGVSELVVNLKEIFPGRKLYFIVAILRDKKLDKMIEDICSVAEKIYISKNESNRAADIEEQMDVVRQSGIKGETAESISTALAKAKSEISENDVIIVTGSLYTISEILRL